MLSRLSILAVVFTGWFLTCVCLVIQAVYPRRQSERQLAEIVELSREIINSY